MSTHFGGESNVADFLSNFITGKPLKPLKKSPTRYNMYVLSVFFVCIFGSLSLVLLVAMYPSHDVSDISTNEFQIFNVLQNLEVLTEGIGERVVFSHNNNIASEWLFETLQEIKLKKSNKNVQIEIFKQPFFPRMNGMIVMDIAPLYNVYAILRNVNDNLNVNNNTLMISSHFDSAFPSKGASDAGIQCCIMIESIRTLVNDRSGSDIRHPVMFFFTNGEETSHSVGSNALEEIPWKDNVKRFVNLEATSTYDDSYLFRYSPSNIVNEIKEVPNIKGDSISMKIMKFIGDRINTDFIIFNGKHDIGGFDFSYFKFGYMYHHVGDVLKNINDHSIQLLGDTIMGIVRVYSYNNDSPLLHLKEDNDDTEYHFTDLYPFGTIVYSSEIPFVCSIISFFFIFTYISCKWGIQIRACKMKRNFHSHLFLLRRMFVVLFFCMEYILASALGLSLCVILSYTCDLINPMVFYSNFNLWFITHVLVTATGVILFHFCSKQILKLLIHEKKEHKFVQERFFAIMLLMSVVNMVCELCSFHVSFLFILQVFCIAGCSFVSFCEIISENIACFRFHEIPNINTLGKMDGDVIFQKHFIPIINIRFYFVIFSFFIAAYCLKCFRIFYDILSFFAVLLGRRVICIYPNIALGLLVWIFAISSMIWTFPLLYLLRNRIKSILVMCILSIVCLILSLSMSKSYSKMSPKLLNVYVRSNNTLHFHIGNDEPYVYMNKNALAKGDLVAKIESMDILPLQERGEVFDFYWNEMDNNGRISCNNNNGHSFCDVAFSEKHIEEMHGLKYLEALRNNKGEGKISLNFTIGYDLSTYVEISLLDVDDSVKLNTTWPNEGNKVKRSSKHSWSKKNIQSDSWSGIFEFYERDLSKLRVQLKLNYCNDYVSDFPFMKRFFDHNEWCAMTVDFLEECEYLSESYYFDFIF